MKPFERYMKTVRGEAVDFLARIPIVMQFAAEYIGSNYGAFASDHRVLVESNIVCARDFGFEQLSTISDPYRETHGFGAAIEYVCDGVPRCHKPPLEDTADLSTLIQPDPLASERMLDRVNAVRAYKAAHGDNYSILGWVEGPAAEAADLRGVSQFMMDFMMDEAFVCELMDRCVEVAIDFARAQIAAGADTIGIGDAVASQISPDLYERLILPREERIIRAIHNAGALVRLHICGNITHLLPGIADLGVDILDVDHMVDMNRVRHTVGPDVVLAGNIDPAAHIRMGSPERIREIVLATYDAVGNPHMVNAGCEIPPGTPLENLRALCEPVPYRA